MKNIVVLYSGDDWKEMILSETTRKSFEQFHRLGLENNVAFFRSSIQWFENATGTFTKAWAFRDERWIRVETPVRPDGILDKTVGRRNTELLNAKLELLAHCPVVNHPFFGLLLDNKFYQAVLFQKYMPKTLLAHSEEDLGQLLPQIPGEKVVFKPLSGSGGEGISIVAKNDLPSTLSFPVIIQEFLEVYPGIPGVSEETAVSDLRLVFVGKKLSYALSRVAQSGSLFTNFHKGASVKRVPNHAVPQDALALGEKILNKLSLFPQSILSIDLMYGVNKKPYLIEINTKPGFDLLYLMEDARLQEDYFRDLYKLFFV